MTMRYDINEAREDYIRRMEAEGNTIVYPKENELLIDIDSETHYEQFVESFEIFKREIDAEYCMSVGYTETESRSGFPRRHIRIELPFPLDTWQRIAWQGALGSDPVRELLSALRAHRGDVHPTLLVEKPKNPPKDFDDLEFL